MAIKYGVFYGVDIVTTQKYTDFDIQAMREAIRMSATSAQNPTSPAGGPFGAAIYKDGKLVAASYNHVLAENDPSAHAEVYTIRQACKALGTWDLSGCTLYTSCEPCPMCLSAIYWAGIKRLCYGNTKADAAAIDFDDSFIYDQLDLDYDRRSVKCEHFMRDAAQKAFRKWAEKEDKVAY